MAIDTVVTFDDLLRQQGKTPASNTSNNSFKASDYYNSGWFSPSSYNSYTGQVGYRDTKDFENYFNSINEKYKTPATNYFDSSAGVENSKSGRSYSSSMYDKYQNGEISLDDYINSIENKYGNSGYENTDQKVDYGNMSGSNGYTGGYTGGYSSSGSYGSGYDSGYNDQLAGIQDYINSMMAAYQQAYEAQLAAIREAQAAQERARREALGYAQSSVNQNSDEALRQAYIQSRMAQRDMPQQLAAQGISGGLSESTAASLQNQYGENRNELEMARQQALAQLASEYAAGAATDASTYNTQIANILGQQAQQNAALQQWGYEQMLNAQQNAASRARSYSNASYNRYDDPEYLTLFQEAAIGGISSNALRNNAASIISQYGMDGYEDLLEQAGNTNTNNGFSFSNGSNSSGIPNNLLNTILSIPSFFLPRIG